jgi:hypothetical protein
MGIGYQKYFIGSILDINKPDAFKFKHEDI